MPPPSSRGTHTHPGCRGPGPADPSISRAPGGSSPGLSVPQALGHVRPGGPRSRALGGPPFLPPRAGPDSKQPHPAGGGLPSLGRSESVLEPLAPLGRRGGLASHAQDPLLVPLHQLLETKVRPAASSLFLLGPLRTTTGQAQKAGGGGAQRQGALQGGDPSNSPGGQLWAPSALSAWPSSSWQASPSLCPGRDSCREKKPPPSAQSAAPGGFPLGAEGEDRSGGCVPDFLGPCQGRRGWVYLILGPQWEGRARTLRRFVPSGSSTLCSSVRVWKPDQEAAPSGPRRLGGGPGRFLFCPMCSGGA